MASTPEKPEKRAQKGKAKFGSPLDITIEFWTMKQSGDSVMRKERICNYERTEPDYEDPEHQKRLLKAKILFRCKNHGEEWWMPINAYKRYYE